MKKLMYLLVVGSLSVFAACGGASTTEGEKTEEVAVCCCDDATCDGSCHGDAAAAAEAHGDHEGHNHDAVACADDCQKACCLGCKATEGTAACIVLADGSMGSCCATTEVTE